MKKRSVGSQFSLPPRGLASSSIAALDLRRAPHSAGFSRSVFARVPACARLCSRRAVASLETVLRRGDPRAPVEQTPSKAEPGSISGARAGVDLAVWPAALVPDPVTEGSRVWGVWSGHFQGPVRTGPLVTAAEDCVLPCV